MNADRARKLAVEAACEADRIEPPMIEGKAASGLIGFNSDLGIHERACHRPTRHLFLLQSISRASRAVMPFSTTSGLL